jgi:hypothetical protein
VDISNAIAGLLGAQHRLLAKRFDPQAVNQVDAAWPAQIIRPTFWMKSMKLAQSAEQPRLHWGCPCGNRTYHRTTTGTINVIDAT